MRKELPRHIAVVAIALIPAVYLLVKWETIPDTVPLHFNGRFEPDRYGSKNELWLVLGIMTGVSLGTYALLENLHKIDPKRRGKPLPTVFHRLSTGLTMFLSALSLLVILSCISTLHLFDRFLVPLLGFIFAFLGNIMHSLKPNYFAGIRIPWTLNSETNWRDTHRFAGKLWFVTGIAMAITGILFPSISLEYIVLAFVAILTVPPIIYSYALYKKETRQ